MARTLVAGVDTSTQSCKVRVTDAETGELVRFGQAKHPNGTSVDPSYWWSAFQEAAEQAGGLDDVSALAVGGQQHGMVILDKQGNVIRDAMLWNDTSSAPQAAALIEKLGAAPAQNGEPEDPIARGKQRWVKAVGSSPVASYTLTKVAWVAENEPENAKKIAAICLPHDWLSWRIAGYGPVAEGEDAHLEALFTDRSDASGTIYYDAASNEYRRDLIAMVLEAAEGAEAAQSHAEAIVLPTVLGPRDAAPVKADPAIAGKNVEGGCLLAPGGGDNAMASLGLGMAVGDVSISLGTSGVAAAISENPTYDLTGAVSGFADCTGHYLPLACTINGSRILDAGRAALGVDYDELAKLAFASKPGAGGITLVPHAEPPECHRHLLRHDSGQHHTREPGPRLRRRTAVLPARLPGAHPIPGRKHHAHSAHRRRREVRSYPHAGTKHSGHGRDPTRHRRIRGHRRGPPGRLGAVRRNRASGMATHHRRRGDRRTDRSRIRSLRQGPRLIHHRRNSGIGPGSFPTMGLPGPMLIHEPYS